LQNMKKQAVFTVLLLGLIIIGMTAAVYASAPVNVTIGYPNNSNGDLGITSGSYWIGQFPIQISSGGTTTSTEAYCLNYDSTINEGATYQANIAQANDTAQWRAVSYILSWYAPTSNNQAAIDQVAIWRILDNYNPNEFNLPSSIETSAINLAGNAAGKDVARVGDQLNWISPAAGNALANPNQTVTFQAKLANSAGAPRPNVQIVFNATLQPPSGASKILNSTYVSTNQTFTDNTGIAQISVTVPSNAQYDSTIKVQAQTQSVWPQEYLDLTAHTSSAQNLIGAGPTLDLTLSMNITIAGFIQVVPESAFGSASMIIAVTAAFTIYIKLKQKKTMTTPPLLSIEEV
jgi:hypothetical protein